MTGMIGRMCQESICDVLEAMKEAPGAIAGTDEKSANLRRTIRNLKSAPGVADLLVSRASFRGDAPAASCSDDTDRSAMVREFFRSVVPHEERHETPTLPSERAIRLRLRLLGEEFVELLAEVFDDHSALDQLRAVLSWFDEMSPIRRDAAARLPSIAKTAPRSSGWDTRRTWRRREDRSERTARSASPRGGRRRTSRESSAVRDGARRSGKGPRTRPRLPNDPRPVRSPRRPGKPFPRARAAGEDRSDGRRRTSGSRSAVPTSAWSATAPFTPTRSGSDMATPYLYLHPRRKLAIEAAIVSALALGEKQNGGASSARAAADAVSRFFPWTKRVEIHRAITRMIAAGRLVPVDAPGRSIPLLALA